MINTKYKLIFNYFILRWLKQKIIEKKLESKTDYFKIKKEINISDLPLVLKISSMVINTKNKWIFLQSVFLHNFFLCLFSAQFFCCVFLFCVCFLHSFLQYQFSAQFFCSVVFYRNRSDFPCIVYYLVGFLQYMVLMYWLLNVM